MHGAKATGLRVIVDDTIKRTITVNLTNKKVSDLLDIIVSADGRPPSALPEVFAARAGGEVIYTIERAGRQLPAAIPVVIFTAEMYWELYGTFVLAGVLAWTLVPRDEGAGFERMLAGVLAGFAVALKPYYAIAAACAALIAPNQSVIIDEQETDHHTPPNDFDVLRVANVK